MTDLEKKAARLAEIEALRKRPSGEKTTADTPPERAERLAQIRALTPKPETR